MNEAIDCRFHGVVKVYQDIRNSYLIIKNLDKFEKFCYLYGLCHFRQLSWDCVKNEISVHAWDRVYEREWGILVGGNRNILPRGAKRGKELRTRFIMIYIFFYPEALILKLFYTSMSDGFTVLKGHFLMCTWYRCDLCLVHQCKLLAGEQSFGES